MHLKKHYDPASLKTASPIVTHVAVLHSGEKWNPSTRIIERGQAEGWLHRDGDRLTIKTGEGYDDLHYRIVVPPGLYCCHCGELCNDPLSAAGHIQAEHGRKKSPSAANPSGYARHNFYMTELIED